MALPPGFLDELRSRVTLAQVVGRKVTWDARKTNAARQDYWAPCPFHAEKSASFHVDDAKGFYHCFGCQAGGDAIAFIRETENVGFMEAVEILAREAGMPMPDRDPAAAARAEAAKGLAEAMEAAVQFYRMQLNSARAAEARAYLDRRDLSAVTRERFEIGFAPDGRTALLEHLTSKGFTRDKLAEAGLIGVPDDGGAAYDRFRGRIMFPIRDARGRAIAFGARALRDGQMPKYLNSPDTPLFDKGRTLYNVGPARAAAGKAGSVVVVEGYMDVIALAQAGIDNAVAPLGTAITEDQLRMLWKLSPEPVAALDGDAAGVKAAHRLMDLALPLIGADRSLRIVTLPGGQDPDDVVRAGGAKAMLTLLQGSRPLVDVLWARETEGASFDSPERRAAFDAKLRAHLARIADENLRTHYQTEIGTRRQALFAPARRPWSGPGGGWTPGRKGRIAPPRYAEGGSVAATRASLLAGTRDAAAEARIRESAILAGCLNHPTLAARFEDRLERMTFVCPDLGEIRDALLSSLPDCLSDGIGSGSLRDAVGSRTGRDPMEALAAVGQVRANPHLGPDAHPDGAATAIEEELTRHSASTGWLAEVREAEQDLAGEADEGVTWRLRQAAEAAHRANLKPLSAGDSSAGSESELSARLQSMLDQQVWKKKR